jgi:hypothetical protein
MPLRCLSGEEVRAGDHVLYAGCMILASTYARVFAQPDNDLDFVSRGQFPAK